MDSFLIRGLLGGLGVLFAFGFIIFIHELGHFVVARRVGIRCPNFAIGFGKPLLAFRWRGTEFSLRLFPFGGYVQMVGEDPEFEGELTWHDTCEHYLGHLDFPLHPKQMLESLESRREEFLQGADEEEQARYAEVHEHVLCLKEQSYESLREIEGNFNSKTIPQRMAVILGGVTMNFISGLMLIWVIGFGWGLGVITQDASPRVGSALDGTPAHKAGLESGDQVLTIQGREILSGSHMVSVISSFPGRPVEITYQRPDGETRQVTLVPDVVLGNYQFTEGEDGLPRVSDASQGEGLKPGQQVSAVEGESVASLAELGERLAVAMAAGSSKPVKISLDTADGLVSIAAEREPVGRIGVALGTVTVIRIVEDVVDRVDPGGSAQEAGLAAGDLVESVNEHPVIEGQQLDQALAGLAGQKLFLITFTVLGKQLVMLPEDTKSMGEAGFSMRPAGTTDVIVHGFRCVGYMIIAPALVINGLLQRVIPVEMVVETSAGPLGIMHMLYALTDNGFAQFLFFVAMINAAVGAFNLIPFPALDGSRFLLLLISAVRRKEFDPDKEARLHYVGLMVLLTVVLLITFMDVKRMISGITLIE